MRDRIKKLPKWAQEYINLLQRDLEHAKRQLSDIEQPAETPISWRVLFQEAVGIPHQARVKFEMPGGFYFEIDHGGTHLRVYLHGGHPIRLAAMPESGSNLLILRGVLE